MGFNKKCPICEQNFSALIAFMTHIKEKHDKVSPEALASERTELKWSFRKA